ncbi:ABC transporter ATP-binding protein [Streptomyces sp. ISL-66]|uniref:ABC transporter ATP-binding protein n=1 Tax=Streptomyces sp. ISL-66 TaxID=2819186 RepID=UPI001BE5BA9F|nr:ABC transporter ATP-binding protein [Streptomyces sp. ISL-66]MBT2470919.1 ABC transporter ATP-binding protein [Streptomyces sp. ISL-66]
MQISDLPYPDPGVPDARSGPRFLWWLGRGQLGGQAKSLSWGMLHFCGVAGLPYAVGLGVDAVVDRDGTRLLWVGGLIALLGVAISLGDAMLHRTAVTNWITAAARVQQLLARKTAELGAALTRRVAAGEVVAVSTGDVEKIGWFVEAVSRFLAAALTLVIGCVALLFYAPAIGVVVAIGMPVLALAVLPLLPRATQRADVQREKAGKATELASDTVAGLRVLRGIGGEELFLSRYREASQEVRKAAVRSARMWALISAIQVLLPGVLLITVVWYGSALVLDDRLAVGELVAAFSAVATMLYPLRHFEEIAMAYSFSRPSAKRAARVLSLSRTDAEAAAAEAAASGDADRAVVADASRAPAPGGDLYDPETGLLAASGRFTAVVCGDPDLAGRLAERLGGHPMDDGAGPCVLLGGVALDGLALDTARTLVLVQDKDPVLLSGTLRELFDVPASGMVTPSAALEAAQCADVLDALLQSAPDGVSDPMDSRITERGRSLSGGQRQRLALARSLVTDPEVLVLDEPTSAVDSHTEARIADGIAQLRAGRTTVVLASSPLLLDRADRVVLIHEGTVAASGTHRELLHGDPRYRAVVTRETEDEQRLSHRQTGRTEPLRADSVLGDSGRTESVLTEIEESA